MNRLSLFWTVFSLGMGLSQTLRAEIGPADRLTAEFFSFDDNRGSAAGSHSFVTFRRVQGGRVVEEVTISFLPSPDFFRRGLRLPVLRRVPGTNYSLRETLNIARAAGARVQSHGVFAVSPDLFQRARAQRDFLQSAAAEYKLLDGRLGGRNTLNCIHAISGMIRRIDTGLSRGETATTKLVEFFLSTGKMRAISPTRPRPTPIPMGASSFGSGIQGFPIGAGTPPPGPRRHR